MPRPRPDWCRIPDTRSSPPPVSRLDPRIEVRDSTIHGSGLFATEPIAADEIVMVLGGTVMTDSEFEAYRHSVDRFSAMAIDDGLHLVQDLDDPASKGNHSCDPNVWMADAVTQVASRDIAAGEEMTTDYALHTVDESWRQQCRCGLALCRGTITGDDWRLHDLQNRYRGHFSPFINRRIG